MCDVDDPKAVHDYDDDPLPGMSVIEAVIALRATTPRSIPWSGASSSAPRSRCSDRARPVARTCTPCTAKRRRDTRPSPCSRRSPAFGSHEAILMNPKWIKFGIWIMQGTDLLAARWPDEHLGINVWSGSHEFKLALEARWPRGA